jgi:hypothetical protein
MIRLSSWMSLISMIVGFGSLRVAQQNAIVRKSYVVGERIERIHTVENDLAWLNAQVVGLTSPARLAHVAEERRLKLVAWSAIAVADGTQGSDHSIARGDPAAGRTHHRSARLAQATAPSDGSVDAGGVGD